MNRRYYRTNLDNWMVVKNVSNSQLARACGVSERTVRRWRMEETDPGIKHIRKILTLLGVTFEELYMTR